MEYPIIFDQGETHGYSAEFGFMPIPELRLSYSHASKLYTDIVGRVQTMKQCKPLQMSSYHF